MGSDNKSRSCTVGKILAALSAGTAGAGEGDGEDNGPRITVPAGFRAEALIYGVVSKGYLSLQSLADGSVDIETFCKALRLSEFDDWMRGQAIKMATAKKEVVEYFE